MATGESITQTLLYPKDQPLDDASIRGSLEILARRGLAVILLWAVLFAIWGLTAPISGAVVAGGIVKVDANRRTVTHRDGGIVAQILVREGEVVAEGQPLVVLDDVRIDASLDLVRDQLEAERVRGERLTAEVNLKLAWPPAKGRNAGKTGNGRLQEVIEREQQVFLSRRRNLDAQTGSLQQQMRDTEAEIAARRRHHQAGLEAVELMREELAANETLMEKGFLNRTRVLGLRRNVSEYEVRLQENLAELSKVEQRASELRGRIAALRDGYLQAASEDLRQTAARIVDFEERLRASEDASVRKVVAAPVAGRLIDLRVNTLGSALGAREPIVDIVPSGTPLLVEARVGVDAISEVQAGMVAEVRLPTYRNRTTELVSGRVSHVSPDAFQDRASGALYYIAHIEVSAESLKQAGDLRLIPGMMAEVFFKARDRTAFDFLVEPLVAAQRRAFRNQ